MLLRKTPAQLHACIQNSYLFKSPNPLMIDDAIKENWYTEDIQNKQVGVDISVTCRMPQHRYPIDNKTPLSRSNVCENGITHWRIPHQATHTSHAEHIPIFEWNIHSYWWYEGYFYRNW
jgi:hypothetical protein